MRKANLLVIVFGLVATAGMARAATVDAGWSLPTTYTNGTAISSADQARIVTTVYFGTASAGPWNQIGTSAIGATSLTGLSVNMKHGNTYYFTVTATLNGQPSPYSPPVSYCYSCSSPSHPGNPRIIFK